MKPPHKGSARRKTFHSQQDVGSYNRRRPFASRETTTRGKAAWVGITIDSYEVGSQNWTDGFAAEFEMRNGYNPPVRLLGVPGGRKEPRDFEEFHLVSQPLPRRDIPHQSGGGPDETYGLLGPVKRISMTTVFLESNQKSH